MIYMKGIKGITVRIDYEDDNGISYKIEEKNFPNATSIYDNEIDEWKYEMVLKYDKKYNFSDWESCIINPFFVYIDKKGEHYDESLIEYYMDL